jgi:ribosomal protein L12E/L44/L45/RPP1/RPP2
MVQKNKNGEISTVQRLKGVHMEEVMKEITARSASPAPIASFITIRF